VMLEKVYNQIHARFERADDYPPERMMEEGIPSGPMKGQRLAKEDWDEMLDEYYSLHGWDVDSGCVSEAEVARITETIHEAIAQAKPAQ